MNNKDNFKEFVKNNPNLIKYIKNGSMTWQKFYEIYDIYGDSSDVWNEYIISDNKEETKTNSSSTITDFMKFFKNIDLDTFQEGVQNIQRVVEMIGDLAITDNKKTEYKPRPLYKHFDD